MQRINTPKLLVSLGVSFAAAAIGSFATYGAIDSWYVGLVKPSFNPPNAVFGPVWTILYTLMGIALYLVWNRGLTAPHVKRAIVTYSAQLGLNTLWSLVFFGLQSPQGGFVVICLLLISIFATIISFWRINRTAALLLVPYILWVSFATVLNFAIMRLN